MILCEHRALPDARAKHFFFFFVFVLSPSHRVAFSLNLCAHGLTTRAMHTYNYNIKQFDPHNFQHGRVCPMPIGMSAVEDGIVVTEHTIDDDKNV